MVPRGIRSQSKLIRTLPAGVRTCAEESTSGTLSMFAVLLVPRLKHPRTPSPFGVQVKHPRDTEAICPAGVRVEVAVEHGGRLVSSWLTHLGGLLYW